MQEKIQRETNEKMNKVIEKYREELTKIRTGKATPALLDGIYVDYFGAKTPLNQVGNISITDPKMIVIQPWDKTILSTIEKEIQKANIGLTPNNDGSVIRLAVPALNEQRRKEIVKSIKKIAEDYRVNIRNVRRESIDFLKTAKKNGDIPEDDEKRLEKEIQKLTDDMIKTIDENLEKKEKEIMEI